MAQITHLARRQVVIANLLGLQLRVAGSFVRCASAFHSDIKVYCKDLMVDGRSILALVSLAAEYGTTMAVEAHGVDAEEAVAALAQLISAPSRDCENQTGEAGSRKPDSPAAQGAQTEGHSTASPKNQHGDHSWKSGPRWDSWRLGPTRGSRNDRCGTTRGRWLRRGSHSAD
jgi:phosphocarrier protein HPr